MDAQLGSAPTVVDALLRGGPATLPEKLRRQRVPGATDKIKVPYLAGYEHFERDGTVAPDGLVVFRWTGRTFVAE
ncbi:hypothetical protein E1258_19605 [Micromonospora sp. KC207]|uniref:Uncharacterized protein n=1 Tax=Micromonospora carbonacea TaxID=47853 RepID=A0A7D6C5V8_9ACTN|nr:MULTISPECIES: DUF5988 family protein [unclassified Micromonospora]QLJ96947.1 hypothetical protein HZU44_18905 [Micromonospora carbonacea]TDC58988.1 hypothetical protein E1258_19605 [Micromonospora sp. KC207]